MCACTSVCTCLWMPPCLPSQNKSCSVERCHNPVSGSGKGTGRGQRTGQPGRAEAGAQACPWGQAKARFQDRGAQPGPISHGLGMWGRGSEGQPQTGHSVPGGKGRLRSITRKGWAQAWNIGALLNRGGCEARREGPGEAQGTEGAR